MKILFPNIPEPILKFFWNISPYDEIYDLFVSVDFSKIKVEIDYISTVELLNIRSVFSDYVENISKMAEGKIEINKSRFGVVESWENYGTWMVPVMIFEKTDLRSNDRTVVLFEGHTRLGILRGLNSLMNTKYKLASSHKAYILRIFD
ncbi:hypothetical protein [Halobacteriovorax sp. RT-2-1]